MNYKNLFIKHNILLTLGHLLIYAKGIILLPILIKNIGVAYYGGYVLLMTSIGFISGISNFGVGFKLQRFMPSAESNAERKNLFYPQFYFKLGSAFIVALLLIATRNIIAAGVFKNEVVFSMYLVAAILIMYVFYAASTDFFRYTHRMGYFTIAVVLSTYLDILFVAVIIYVFHYKSLNLLLLANLSALIFVSVPLLVKIYKEIGFKFSGTFFSRYEGRY